MGALHKAYGGRMKIATFVSYQMTSTIGEYIPVESHEFEYDGPLALADRSAVQSQKNLRDVTGAAAASAGGEADTEHGELAPFYGKEMTAEHLFDPSQTGELLTAGMAPAGSELGNVQHEAELQGARTRNASGFTKSL